MWTRRIQAFVVLVGWGMSACSDPPVRPSTENILASPAACAEYCAEVQLACGDAGDGTSQYESSVACEAQCAGWAPLLAGETGDTAANTIGCRLHYARKINAETDPPQKEDLACQLCMFAGPTGGGVCGSWCDTYCHLATFNCGGTSPLHADVAACQAACDEMFCVGQPFSEEFDSVQCRITHAALAGVEPDESHCESAGIRGGEACVGARVGDSCDNPIVVSAPSWSLEISPAAAGFRDAHDPSACDGPSGFREVVLEFTTTTSGFFALESSVGAGMYVLRNCGTAAETCEHWSGPLAGGGAMAVLRLLHHVSWSMR